MGPSRVLWPQTYRLPDTQQKPAGWEAAWTGKRWVALGSSSQTQDPQLPDRPHGQACQL